MQFENKYPLRAGFIGLGNYASEGEPLGVIKGSYGTRYDPATQNDNELGIPQLGVEGQLLINATDGKIINSDDLGLPIETVGDPNPDWNADTLSLIS